MTRALLDPGEQLRAGLVAGHATNALELAIGARLGVAEHDIRGGQGLLELVGGELALGHHRLVAQGGLLACGHALLEARELYPLRVQLAFEVATELEQL